VASMKAAIVIFPGSNREHDVALALKRATGQEPVRVWHRDGSLPDADLIVLPGGFAYGDYLRCGAMASHSSIMRDVRALADPDTLNRLEQRGLVAFRYCSAAGQLGDDDNFNGSARAIAGVFNETRTVLGLMPHPENATDPLLGGTDGQAFFSGLIGALQ